VKVSHSYITSLFKIYRDKNLCILLNLKLPNIRNIVRTSFSSGVIHLVKPFGFELARENGVKNVAALRLLAIPSLTIYEA